MRTLAIGDIHGCSRALDLLLAAIDLRAGDTLITLGDYVDRGPDSRGVLDRLIALHQSHPVISLRGNHEIMMLQGRINPVAETFWREVGGDEALASYDVPGKPAKLEDVPAAHWQFIEEQCVDWWENDTHFFVHANVYPQIPLADQPGDALFWHRFSNRGPHISGKIMVCGHTNQKSGLPVNLGHAICIDTWVYGKGWLTCLDVTNGLLFQANQAGQQRQLRVDDLG